MKVTRFFSVAVFLICSFALSAGTVSENVQFPFVKNSGQHPYDVLFSVAVPGGTAFGKLRCESEHLQGVWCFCRA